jgi:hypothetical protein
MAEIGVAAYLGQSVQIVNVNFAQWKDSTSLELKIREIFSLVPVKPILANHNQFKSI